MVLFCHFPLMESNQRSSPADASTAHHKKTNLAFVLHLKIEGNAVFCDPPFSAHSANTGVNGWTRAERTLAAWTGQRAG